jgi:hypothetical protein
LYKHSIENCFFFKINFLNSIWKLGGTCTGQLARTAEIRELPKQIFCTLYYIYLSLWFYQLIANRLIGLILLCSKQGMNINLLCGKNFVHPKNPSLCTWWWLTFNKNLSISKVIITCYVYNMNLHCGFNWIPNVFSFFYVMGSCTNIAYSHIHLCYIELHTSTTVTTHSQITLLTIQMQCIL